MIAPIFVGLFTLTACYTLTGVDFVAFQKSKNGRS
jgi:hypothetical protein